MVMLASIFTKRGVECMWPSSCFRSPFSERAPAPAPLLSLVEYTILPPPSVDLLLVYFPLFDKHVWPINLTETLVRGSSANVRPW